MPAAAAKPVPSLSEEHKRAADPRRLMAGGLMPAMRGKQRNEIDLKPLITKKTAKRLIRRP